MTKIEIENITENLALPVVEELNYELVDVEYVKEGKEMYLRIYLDKDGGIDINDCEKFTRIFNEILDKEDYIQDTYIFEVSSAGLTRPLKKDKDFNRYLQKPVECKVFKAVNGYKNLIGILEYFDKNIIKIDEIEIERKNISLICPYIEF